MINPNEYDDDAYLEASSRNDWMKLWEAGADFQDLIDQVANHLSNCLDADVTLDAEATPRAEHVGGGPKP